MLRHETRHALDQIHEISRFKEVFDAWQKERKHLLTLDQRGWCERETEVFRYVTQDYPSGLEETVAELYAQVRGGGTGEEIDLRLAHPETAAIPERIFKALKI
ncbi:MAG: hypothetical protein LBO79_10480 [Zoogloeaceae bacterium]|nr:hypothetical protein [Zoogloeaceae bacterium]